MKKKLIPFVLFIVVVGFLVIGLNRNPSHVPSPLIGKPAPEFSVPTLAAAVQSPKQSPGQSPGQSPEQTQVSQTLSEKDLLGKVWLFNVWASWCPTCRAEHPVLMQLARNQLVDIIGLDYKDTVAEGREFLQELGNPFSVIGFDKPGDVAIDYGVYGVPETFVIDKQGIVRLKFSGQLTQDYIDNKIIPLVASLQAEGT